MEDQTPTPSDLGEGHFPLKAGDWLVRGSDNSHLAQVKAIYVDAHNLDEKPKFLVDLWLYNSDGRRIGRVSENEPFEIEGKVYRGPSTYEPAMELDGDWRRIEEPEFPLKMVWVTHPAEKAGMVTMRPEYPVEPRAWGNYKRRVRKPVQVVAVTKPNFDPELEKRSRLMTAQALRDSARERGGDPDLIRRAEQLEREAAAF